MLIILCIVCALFIVVVPSYSQKRNQIVASEVAEDFRIYASSLSHYSTSCDDWPHIEQSKYLPETLAKEIPDFHLRSTVGGHWEWSSSAENRELEIRLVDHQAHLALMERIDQVLDDGNLSTGNLTGDKEHLCIVVRH